MKLVFWGLEISSESSGSESMEKHAEIKQVQTRSWKKDASVFIGAIRIKD